MENTIELSSVFNIKIEKMKYQILNLSNIPSLLDIFKLPSKNAPLSSEKESETSFPTPEKITSILTYIKESFLRYRINTIYFENYSKNKSLYLLFIDFYLDNSYSS